MEKEYIIDLGTFTIMAKDEKDAEEQALKRIQEGDVEIDSIILSDA